MSEQVSGVRLRGLFGRSDPDERPEPDEPSGPDGQPQRVIAVLGMHRSGTSSLVGSLEEAGLPLGEVRTTGGDSNEKGHREPGDLIKLHEDVLITSGGSWHRPPEAVTWTAKQRRRRDAFIATHDQLSLWGFKEPRTLLVMDGWLDAIPTLEMVGTFRHPAVVARSLQRRHGSDTPEMWLELWLAYNSRLLDLVEARHFPIIDFDLPGEQYQLRLRDVAAELGLRPPDGEAEFFEASLRTSQQAAPDNVALPAAVADTHKRLIEIAALQAAGTRG